MIIYTSANYGFYMQRKPICATLSCSCQISCGQLIKHCIADGVQHLRSKEMWRQLKQEASSPDEWCRLGILHVTLWFFASSQFRRVCRRSPQCTYAGLTKGMGAALYSARHTLSAEASSCPSTNKIDIVRIDSHAESRANHRVGGWMIHSRKASIIGRHLNDALTWLARSTGRCSTCHIVAAIPA